MGGVNQDEAVALGAAIQAAMEIEAAAPPVPASAGERTYLLASKKKVQDVIAHSLGMIAESSDRLRYLNSVLIQKNLPIPSTQTRPYQMPVRRSAEAE